MFPAANEDQWSLIKEVIDECDYYVVVVGGRYGSTSVEGISYTEMEYDYAVASGIPILGFVHGKPDEIPVGKSDIEADARAKLDAFRAKVMTRMVKQYETPAELGSAVSRGLNRMIKRNPRPGWVKGDQAMTAETRAEIAELRATVATMEAAKVEADAQSTHVTELDSEQFQFGQDEVEVTFDYTGYQSGRGAVRLDGKLWFTWDEIVMTLGPFMIDEASETKLRSTWDAHVLKDIHTNHSDWPQPSPGTVKTTDSSWGTIIVQLRAVGALDTGIKKRTVTDNSVYWRLTEAGDRYLVQLRAIRQPGPDDD